MSLDRCPWLEGFRALPDGAESRDPLAFPGYAAKLRRAQENRGERESVCVGTASVDGHGVVAAVFDWGFLGGSMGEATGLRLVQAIDAAIERHVPLVTVVASGGARMQEGMRSLIQMQAVAAGLVRLGQAGVAHLAVACNPTTGGVWASLASAADVVLAAEGATVAFAGSRVRGTDDDGDAFHAEGKLCAGAVDRLFAAPELPRLVALYVRAFAAAMSAEPVACPPPRALPDAAESGTGWAAVALARAPRRPRAGAYLESYFDELAELGGDRVSGRDAGVRCGIGLRDGDAIVYIAQMGGAIVPAGFRTAMRALELAERLRAPVLTLIDTPGAANDADAERQGVGTAIAQTFAAVASATVPVTSLLVGEGGSGGALALAAPANLWAVPSSYFSVIAPEAAAAILHRDRGRAPEVADALRIGPRELVELGVIEGIVERAPRSREASVA